MEAKDPLSESDELKAYTELMQGIDGSSDLVDDELELLDLDNVSYLKTDTPAKEKKMPEKPDP